MTNSEIVKAYAALHKEPIQKLIPEFYQKWTTPYGTGAEYWRSSTCERSLLGPYNWSIVRSPGKGWVNSAYIHYIPQYDMLELSVVAINNKGRHQNNDIYRWRYTGQRVFLIKGDTRPYDAAGEELWPEANGRYYNKELFKFIRTLQSSYPDYFSESKAAESFCQSQTDTLYFAHEYSKFMKPRKGEDKLPEPQKDIHQIFEEYDLFSESERNLTCRPGSCVTGYYERINDAYSVIRCIEARKKTEADPISIREIHRIYITKKGLILLNPHFGTWRVDEIYDLSPVEVINKQEFIKCKAVSQVYEIAPKLNSGKGDLENILILIQYPIIECLHKAGYVNLASSLASRISFLPYRNFKWAFCNLFGKIELMKGNLYQTTGCNKWMLKAMENFDRGYEDIGAALKIYRQLFGEDFMHFTKDKIEKYLLAFVALSQCERNKGIPWNRILTGHDNIRTEDKPVIERFVKLYNGGDRDIFAQLADIIRLHRWLGLNYSDAVIDTLRTSRNIYELHDRLTEQWNARRLRLWQHSGAAKKTEYQKTFDQLQEERKAKFDYEDDTYLIRVPKNMDEIAEEGRKLRHCVGSYANLHAQGQTNILFLRRKVIPDAPYYTIEVHNNKVIQIHGFANKWLGNEPDAISFVYTWVKKLGIQCDKAILLCRSQGYSQTRVMLDESYLYRRTSMEKQTA